MFYTLSPGEGAIISLIYNGAVFYLPFYIEKTKYLNMKFIFSILPRPHLAPLCHVLEIPKSLA